MGEISVKTGNNARNGGKNSLNRLIRCVCGKKIGPDPRNFNQRVSLGRHDLLIRTFLSGIVEKDMISVAIGPPVKLCVAATPEYFARYGKPRHPHDLLNHQCVVFRYPSGKPFHWQFAKELEIAVAGNIILDDVDAELEAVLMGAGIGYLLYEQIKEYLDTGRLECVLGDWSTERPGFQIYYPNRQYMSCGLRAFLDYVKTGQICQSQRHRPQ
nr:LysR substrate-binding domain-containing protein [Escherichia coli]